ncbi:dynamin family protein [Streptomyces doebereineriae]|uniref:Dynamin family protein n=1 Tax=Streptomyces doebereineriae TaxID=3075528 RepID=A0ABU2VBU1_9ACTN|nr:dynamin family protein [Streptomyces sp. DSM 41640]MDT0483030.1 dynamin family protein [Streptomyces sp. DSM 41640]
MDHSERGGRLADLHQDLIRGFERVVALFERSARLERNNNHEGAALKSKVERKAAELNRHLESVRELQLVMPIVAPMKAGKSTLINAIVGYQLLPARANPMTTVPTRIILVEGMALDRPELTIPDSLLSLYDTLERKLLGRLRSGWTVGSIHGYLTDLAERLNRTVLPRLERRYIGAADVHKALARINDEMRLASLALNDDYLSYMLDLPELRTGHLHPFTAGGVRGGQLVIIDTPGPNEHAIAARLGPALERQLHDAHALLVVLDYTQMGSEAAVDIENRLGRHVEVIGKERLYAVVNKVDARKTEDDLSADETRQLVRNTLAISAGQVHEVVANWGLLGSRVLTEQRLLGDRFRHADSEAAIAVLRELNPLEDASELEALLGDTPPVALTRTAERLLVKSQVVPLIEKVIDQLRGDAAPAVMKSALHRYQAAVEELRTSLALERSAAEHDAKEIELQLAKLKSEMEELADHRERLPTVVQLQERFRREIEGFASELEANGHQIIQTVGMESARTEKSNIPLVDQTKSIVRKLFDAVSSNRSVSDEIEFPTLEEATRLKDEIAGAVTAQLRELLDQGRVDLDKLVRRTSVDIVNEQESKVRGLIERAARTLSNAFDVDVKPPPPGIHEQFRVELEDPAERMRVSEEEYEETRTRRIWWTLWIATEEVTVTATRPVKVSVYVVSCTSIERQLRELFDAQIDDMRDSLRAYVGSELTGELTAYYDGLGDYLKGYHDVLTSSLGVHQKSEEQRIDHGKTIRALEAELVTEAETLDDYLCRLTA